jgi:hypothetical protein
MKGVKKTSTDNNTKWQCGKCNGDVRLPPPPTFQPTTTMVMDDGSSSSNFSNVHHVKCALKCSTPRYHLTCTSVPKGSQIYQCAIIISSEALATTTGGGAVATTAATVSASDDTTSDALGGGGESVTTSMIAQKMKQPHSSSSTNNVWWNPNNIPYGKQPHRSNNNQQQSLPGSISSHSNSSSKKNWPTSMLSFICPKCDVEGTSRYLLEYFERFASMKKLYYGEYLKNVNKRCNNNHSVTTNCRLDRVDESVDARTGETFLWHLMKDNRKDYIHKKNIQVMSSNSSMPSPESNTELETTDNNYYNWNPSEIQLSNMTKVITTLSEQQQQLHSSHNYEKQQNNKRQKKSAAIQLSASYLVGMPIRLYNPIDNTYHTGRIIDYQLNAPYAVDDEPLTTSTTNTTTNVTSSNSPPNNIGSLVDKEICTTLYLIRFRHGVDNRKISVHKWIYIEEHAVTVGGEICWANVGYLANGTYITDSTTTTTTSNKVVEYSPNKLNNDDGITKSSADDQQYISPYRPVQIVFRSLLEMISCQNLNPLNDALNVLAMGFGQTFSHVRLSIIGGGKQCDDKTTIDVEEDMSILHTELIPFTSNNPKWLDQFLHRAELSDEELVIGIGMACMEKEEERRIRARLNLSVSYINPELHKTTEDGLR